MNKQSHAANRLFSTRTALLSAALTSLLSALPLVFVTGAALAQAPDADPLPADPQQFSLFGEVDAGSSSGRDSSERPSGRRGRASTGASANGPEFTLVGTSRIGDRYSAIVKNRDGTEVVVTSGSGRSTGIEGYSQYSVVDVGPGRVSIQYPGSSSCVEFRDQGVSCNTAANIASLELTVGEPIPRAVITARNESAEDAEAEAEAAVSEDEPEEPANPFAALRARALQNGDAPGPSANSRRSFTPRRIDPADVPPGMRIVSTPFGDRLVRE